MSPQFKQATAPVTPEPKKVSAPVAPKMQTSKDRVQFDGGHNLKGYIEGNELHLIVPDVTVFEKPSKSGKSFLIALTGGWKSLVYAPSIGKSGANIVANITIGVKSDDYTE